MPADIKQLCGAIDIGDYPIRECRCDRELGHAGWHNESATGSSWPPKQNHLLKKYARTTTPLVPRGSNILRETHIDPTDGCSLPQSEVLALLQLGLAPADPEPVGVTETLAHLLETVR